ncbi:MAG TPA: hypothetical protein VEA38_24840 [Terriglobales bacterium]|nr:hypothetical protein [Terriglobales bacterium]
MKAVFPEAQSTQPVTMKRGTITSGFGLAARQLVTRRCRLYQLSLVTTGARHYIMLFDTTSAPSAGATPDWIEAIAAFAAGGGGQLQVDFGQYGLAFANGIYVAASTTAPTLTFAASNAFIGAYQYA